MFYINLAKLRGKKPIYFQPLEQELIPVLKYLNGYVLNAGCGERDISNLLLSNNANKVDNCDIYSSIPNAIKCDLSRIPSSDKLYRILKSQGHLILCIPFLQPYHPCLNDYQRYTKDGLIELVQKHNYEIIEIIPTHSIAQTLSWILWEYLLESNKKILRYILYLPIYIWTRISAKTDLTSINNANSYQIVVRKK